MSIPPTSRVFRRTEDGKDIEQLLENLPKDLKPGEVLIRIHAVSLNFRDVAMLNGRYPMPCIPRGIPCSDAAGTVVSVGSSVSDFKKGDHVSPTLRLSRDTDPKGLGGDHEGVLRDYAIFESEMLVHNPDFLSFEEASTIPIAGLTAWASLARDDPRKARSMNTALMQGTGGVSLFSLLICLAADIIPIVTSSSDEKLSGLRKLVKDGQRILTVNYRNTPDWATETLKLTNNNGVDLIVNNVGPSSIEQSLKALKKYGTISLVGFLGGTAERYPDITMDILLKSANVQGIVVGSKEDHQDLCNFLGEKRIHLGSIIDRVFDFQDSSKAFKYLDSGAHTGKVVIKL